MSKLTRMATPLAMAAAVWCLSASTASAQAIIDNGSGVFLGVNILLGGRLKTGNLWTAQNRQFPWPAETL